MGVQQVMAMNRPHCKIATSIVITLSTTTAARCTVATVQCQGKTALAVVSVIILPARASVSADTLALLVRRWKRCRKLINLDKLIRISFIPKKKKKKKKKKSTLVDTTA